MKEGTSENDEFQNQDMEMDNVAKFLRGKTILITGATGFLAKVLLEKILRLQPNVKKLYLLLRASDDKSATQRLHDEILRTKLFKVLRDKWSWKFDSLISSKVVAVAGDISFESLGIANSKLREIMWGEIEIVVNVAGTTDFNERYDVALDINTFGTFNVLNYGKKCDKIKLFLHVSTAYVCGERQGVILEKRFHMGETLNRTGNIDIFEEKRIVEEKLEQLQNQCAPNNAIKLAMKEFGLQRAKLNGWPNTYVFTKAMGEMLLGNFKGDLPLVILRPTMVTSTYKQPFPGWIEGVRTVDRIVVSYGKGKLPFFLGDLNSPLDVIPVDMVVNAMVVAMQIHYADRRCSRETIYHISSSSRNPMKLSDFHRFLRCYFTKNPWIDTNGKIVKVSEGTVFSTPHRFFLFIKLKYVLPLKVFCLIDILCCQRFKKMYTNLDRKIKYILRLAEFYKPYVFFTGIFDDRNLETLQRVAEERGIDAAEFNLDSKTIDWEDYIMNIHIPGLFRHEIKSDTNLLNNI
ncbi:putative fatty acyl-CoA reductase 5 [Hibiscus syriacus]|uniref:Fatty acyl-CoA reductase n=1 Tax=Hibiscus syriacus TaxID=106335 RepID=A0A6A2XXJ0_HIBSY|nr:fatty acyl-CoA reductase 1-like [Hibiscus syriacus]KAE8674870.1 putative fatty acyl-CoA reductase 5 [Hibiscus syriacus]